MVLGIAPDLSKIPPACGRIFFNSARRAARPHRGIFCGADCPHGSGVPCYNRAVGMTGLGRPTVGAALRAAVEISNAALSELGGLIGFPGESGCLKRWTSLKRPRNWREQKMPGTLPLTGGGAGQWFRRRWLGLVLVGPCARPMWFKTRGRV